MDALTALDIGPRCRGGRREGRLCVRAVRAREHHGRSHQGGAGAQPPCGPRPPTTRYLGSPPGSEPGRGNGPASGDPALDPRRAAFGRAGPVQRARARAGRKEEAEAEEDPFRCSSSSVTARL
ncbi:unnamed protein product [Prorocentrum cordatum]|uniref:Uncharacterized protein n=1 Tax=Prorocentrum cordatum TaxID=2364126 RepID=A0ABN9W1M3_9DINO|nr:unnamed protein product [Polarella glacialis]